MDYVMFVDESGDHNLTAIDSHFPIFCLAGCVFERSYYHSTVRPRMEAIKERFWATNEVVFHSYDIRKHQGAFRLLGDPNTREEFYQEMNQALTDLDFAVIAIVLLKQDHVIRYGNNAFNPYQIALELLLERYTLLMQRVGDPSSTGYVLAESRGKTQDQWLKEAYRRFRNDGTRFQRDLTRITSLKTLRKTENIIGLQIADLVAYPVATKVLRPYEMNPAFDVLLPKIDVAPPHKGGKVLGYGIKIFPSPSLEHYLLWGQ